MRWVEKAEHGLLAQHELRIDAGEFWVREYDSRLAIARLDGSRLTWEELQAVKSHIWGGGCFAIEAYPADSEVVNLRHTRHLWRLTHAAEMLVRYELRHPEFE